jgi:hypothetical protein
MRRDEPICWRCLDGLHELCEGQAYFAEVPCGCEAPEHEE